jgi:hypothetical protein
MKLFLSLFMALSCLSIFAQEDPVIYTDVVKVDSNNADQLYQRAKLWVAETYNSAQDVVQLDDATSHTLLIKGVMIYKSNVEYANSAASGKIDYTLKILTKDGRYKYSLENFIHTGSPWGTANPDRPDFGLITTAEQCPREIKNSYKKWRQKVWVDIKAQIESYATNVVSSLKAHMGKKAVADNDDW